jgi:hypothetical protein
MMTMTMTQRIVHQTMYPSGQDLVKNVDLVRGVRTWQNTGNDPNSRFKLRNYIQIGLFRPLRSSFLPAKTELGTISMCNDGCR